MKPNSKLVRDALPVLDQCLKTAELLDIIAEAERELAANPSIALAVKIDQARAMAADWIGHVDNTLTKHFSTPLN